MFFGKKVDIDNILICIGKKDDNNEIKIPYLDDLELYFVIDKGNAFEILNKKEFCKLNISIEELKVKAKENVKNKVMKIYKEIPLLKNSQDDVIIPYDADEVMQIGYYNFWTSLVLLPEFWNSENELCFEKKWKKYYIGMPCRNYLIIGNAEKEHSKLEILRLIKEFENDKNNEIEAGNFEVKREISNKIFIMNNGLLEKEE